MRLADLVERCCAFDPKLTTQDFFAVLTTLARYTVSREYGTTPQDVERLLAVLDEAFPAISKTTLRVICSEHLASNEASDATADLIYESVAPKHAIASVNLGLNPVACCSTPNQDAVLHQAVLWRLDGPQKIIYTTRLCRNCHCTHGPTYFDDHATQVRTYYAFDDTSQYMRVTPRQIFHLPLILSWRNSLVVSHTAFASSVRSYKMTHQAALAAFDQYDLLPATAETAFFLHSLLRHYKSNLGRKLCVSNVGLLQDALDVELVKRNTWRVENGFGMDDHVCDGCFRKTGPDSESALRLVELLLTFA